MHPVVANLSEERRRELFANPHFASFSPDRRVQLLDEVMKVRASLDSNDKLDAFDDQDKLMADAAELKDALNIALTVLGRRHRRIGFDIIDGLADYHHGDFTEASRENRTAMGTMRRMAAIAERLEPHPREDDRQKRTRRNFSEAHLLRWVLEDFDVKVSMRTPDKDGPPNHGLELIGLLSDPPTTADVIKRKRLRC
jgi:hypothetical protein